MFYCTMALYVEGSRALVVTFEDDELFGGGWRMRRLLVLTGGIRVSVYPSTDITAFEDRLRLWRYIGLRRLRAEDLNSTLEMNVVLASEVILELMERGLVRWTDVERVARNPEALRVVSDMVGGFVY